jgi:hypothetical protein
MRQMPVKASISDGRWREKLNAALNISEVIHRQGRSAPLSDERLEEFGIAWLEGDFAMLAAATCGLLGPQAFKRLLRLTRLDVRILSEFVNSLPLSRWEPREYTGAR